MVGFSSRAYFKTAIIAVLLCVGVVPARASDVFVYGEFTCSAAGVLVELLVDVTGDPIRSAGVKLSYDASEFSVATATKNEDVWYLGDDSTRYAYTEPDTRKPGEVLLLTAILDEDRPGEGVEGKRILLGSTLFERSAGSPLSHSLSLARSGSYRNFVTIGGVTLDDAPDGVAFGAVRPRSAGDANGDGRVDGGDYTIWADQFGRDTDRGARDGDFNCDGGVDGSDYTIWADNFGAIHGD